MECIEGDIGAILTDRGNGPGPQTFTANDRETYGIILHTTKKTIYIKTYCV